MELIRHNLSGVWFGTFRREGDEWISDSAKRLRRWFGPSDCSGIAAGAALKDDSWCTPAVAVRLTSAQTCEVLYCTESARQNLNSVQVRDVP